MGEGAAIVVVRGIRAWQKARGAKIYAEVAGYGTSSDAYHITSLLRMVPVQPAP